MDRRDIILKQTAKYRIFVMAVFVLYIFQSTPGFLSVFGLKPVFVLPFCIVLSMLDENWQAGFVYLAGGGGNFYNSSAALLFCRYCFCKVFL